MWKFFRNISMKKTKHSLFIWSIVLMVGTLSCGTISDVLPSYNNTETTLPSMAPTLAEDVVEPIGDSQEERPVIVEPEAPSRIEVFSLTMPQFDNRDRNIQVYLPPDYDTQDRHYPVIYLLDGEYLFNPPTDTGGDYSIDETLDRLFVEGYIEGMIAVGIEVDYDYRWDEYTPWVNHNMYDWVKEVNSEPIEGGEGFEFLAFIVETLKPEIDSRYRTLPDRENTLIGGFCRTAIVPLVGGFTYPEVFSKVIAMSPTVWLAENGGQWLSDNQLINFIDEITVPENVRFFIHVGTEESSGNRPPIDDQNGKRITYPQAYIEGAEALYGALIENGVPTSNVQLEIIEGAAGGRDTWAERIDDALVWLMKLN